MAFYTRTIQIDGVTYKQITPTQWQNLKTGEILDNTKISFIVNQFKARQVPVTPSAGPVGGCCEIVNGVMVCSEKTEEACSDGCFKGDDTNCNITEENPNACSTCVHCCFVGSGCIARTPAACLAAGGTYFGSNGCTACKFGVCSSDTVISQRFFGDGCTGVFIEGGSITSFDQGVFCTGSGVGQTCFGLGQRYQALSSNFIAGGTCANCILGACCTGGGCLGITSQAACSLVFGLFYPGQTCRSCDFGVYCTGAGNDRTCIRTGYRGEALSSEFTAGATCSRCIMGTCCVNGDRQVGVRQSDCAGVFFAEIFNQNACDIGSCCVGATCNENIFRYNCAGVFNNGMTCIACSDGACCLPSGCTLTTFGSCFAQGGTFFGGATCSACDDGACCHQGNCTDQKRGNVCSGTFYVGANCSTNICRVGTCCVGATCIGTNLTNIDCNLLSGSFYTGLTCIACATGANCISPEDPDAFEDRTCDFTNYGNFIENDPLGYFGFGRTCSDCEIGSCCPSLQTNDEAEISIRGECNTSSGSYGFFKGQTLQICATGVFCTGSGVGQTCFGLGYRGQSLTNNFIQGATCNSCILGACCTGGTCLGGGLTSQAACSSVGGVFFGGRTCTACDFGVYCTGATCLQTGFRGQSLTNNFIVGATCSSCILGACCTGGTCSGGGQTSQAACSTIGGLFYPGATCRSCDFGVYCTGATCFELGYRAQALTNNFIQGATCNSCILGACCTGGTCLGGGQTSQAACSIAGGTFYVGATCTQCVTGVFCTGSGVGQTCFGLGHRGQSLTNNFIAGATCSSCILGACCTGGTCLGGGLTSQAACSAVGGLFYAGTTCVSCDYGVYCTGSNETTSCLGLGYRAQNLSNQFVISGSCALDCVYGSCCQGTTCLGITKQANCLKPNAFFAGMTCAACDTGTGACCTGGSSSITTITGCNALGGIFFPEGTTALCITGSCCTGGTCTQEILGRSGNCQLFIAGATCGICDTGVYCTGATCLQLGFRGQSLSNNFIQGATCNSCILGICCTGGTCIGGGQTAQINCPSSVGSFVVGATQCSACGVNVNCCVGGTCSYILAEQCLAQNGIVFEGSQDCSLCDIGAFCTGNTCAGLTLKGFNLSDTFIKDGNCSNCITGVCCDFENEGTLTTQSDCTYTFYAGETDVNFCKTGLTFGVCCDVNNQCEEDVEQNSCFGYFIPNTIASQYNLYCSSNPCEYGVCCKENEIVSITGGVCVGTMRRAECAVTAGTFFSLSEGATCSNCLYTPMIGSALFENMADGSGNPYSTRMRPTSKTGWTGNEQFPRLETKSSGRANTWLNRNGTPYYYSPPLTPSQQAGATLTGVLFFKGSGTYLDLGYYNLRDDGAFTPFRTWWGGQLTTTFFGFTGNWQGTTGLFDYSPVFNSGITREIGFSYGYIDGLTFASGRYARLLFGYGNPQDPYYNKTMIFRYSHTQSSAMKYSRNDATIHAGLDINTFNTNISQPNSPFSNSDGTNIFSSPVLIQMFPENPLARRIRPIGSCCKGNMCIGIVTQDHCAFTGGTFYVNQYCTRCYPENIFGNCCVGGTHAGYTSLGKCDALSGVFFEGTTFNAQTCVQGIICNENKTCYQGISYSYYGSFNSSDNKFFVPGDFRNTLGCSACDASLCCTGATCLGILPNTTCTSLGGVTSTIFDCGTELNNCDIGVCCPFDGGCGVFTNRANCLGDENIFIVGATVGATCSACSSLMRLSQSAPGVGVTYDIVFNMGTTNGKFFDQTIWVQEKPGLAIRRIRMTYVGMTGNETVTLYANTRMDGLTLHPNGFIGSAYVHGCSKNLQPYLYIDPVYGITGQDKEPFTSLTYEDYDSGWKGGQLDGNTRRRTFLPGATDDPDQYSQFDLRAFLATKNQLSGNGITIGAGDSVLINTTNFNPFIQETLWAKYTSGYPYQMFTSRANSLSFGLINCLTAERAQLAGSTLCFRPPVTWPDEDKQNKPIYFVSSIDNRIPGLPGNTLITLNLNDGQDLNVANSSGYVIDSSGNRLSVLGQRNSVNFARAFTQMSEYSGGQNYGIVTPIWTMFGARQIESSYGPQYIGALDTILTIVHATGPDKNHNGVLRTFRFTYDERKDMVARLVQYGLDSWGAQKNYCRLGAGAGQKAGSTRPWISVAGYFIGVTAMYDPEETVLQDTARLEKFTEYYFPNTETCTPKGDCTTSKGWNIYRAGSTSISEPNIKVLKRSLAQWFSNAAQVTYEYVNDPANLVLHYEYIGKGFRAAEIKDFSPTGITGITFFNILNHRRELRGSEVTVIGDFGVIRWGTGNTLPVPSPMSARVPFFTSSVHTGTENSLQGMWLRVVSGPGSSGGSGSRYYRVIGSNPDGFATTSTPLDSSIAGGGYQLVIGQTWTDGIPDHTSVIKLYPFIEEDFIGLTRPSTLGLSGIAEGTFPQHLRDSKPGESCASAFPERASFCSLYDATSSNAHAYFNTAGSGWQTSYSFMDFITKTRGITLVSDVYSPMDTFRFYLFKSPWNLYALHGTTDKPDSIISTWYGGYKWSSPSVVFPHINFAKHFPGIKNYNGITV